MYCTTGPLVGSPRNWTTGKRTGGSQDTCTSVGTTIPRMGGLVGVGPLIGGLKFLATKGVQGEDSHDTWTATGTDEPTGV